MMSHHIDAKIHCKRTGVNARKLNKYLEELTRAEAASTQRNQELLSDINDVTNNAMLMQQKTEHLRNVRNQYEKQFSDIYPKRSENAESLLPESYSVRRRIFGSGDILHSTPLPVEKERSPSSFTAKNVSVELEDADLQMQYKEFMKKKMERWKDIPSIPEEFNSNFYRTNNQLIELLQDRITKCETHLRDLGSSVENEGELGYNLELGYRTSKRALKEIEMECDRLKKDYIDNFPTAKHKIGDRNFPDLTRDKNMSRDQHEQIRSPAHRHIERNISPLHRDYLGSRKQFPRFSDSSQKSNHLTKDSSSDMLFNELLSRDTLSPREKMKLVTSNSPPFSSMNKSSRSSGENSIQILPQLLGLSPEGQLVLLPMTEPLKESLLSQDAPSFSQHISSHLGQSSGTFDIQNKTDVTKSVPVSLESSVPPFSQHRSSELGQRSGTFDIQNESDITKSAPVSLESSAFPGTRETNFGTLSTKTSGHFSPLCDNVSNDATKSSERHFVDNLQKEISPDYVQYGKQDIKDPDVIGAENLRVASSDHTIYHEFSNEQKSVKISSPTIEPDAANIPAPFQFAGCGEQAMNLENTHGDKSSDTHKAHQKDVASHLPRNASDENIPILGNGKPLELDKYTELGDNGVENIKLNEHHDSFEFDKFKVKKTSELDNSMISAFSEDISGFNLPSAADAPLLHNDSSGLKLVDNVLQNIPNYSEIRDDDNKVESTSSEYVLSYLIDKLMERVQDDQSEEVLVLSLGLDLDVQNAMLESIKVGGELEQFDASQICMVYRHQLQSFMDRRQELFLLHDLDQSNDFEGHLRDCIEPMYLNIWDSLFALLSMVMKEFDFDSSQVAAIFASALIPKDKEMMHRLQVSFGNILQGMASEDQISHEIDFEGKIKNDELPVMSDQFSPGQYKNVSLTEEFSQGDMSFENNPESPNISVSDNRSPNGDLSQTLSFEYSKTLNDNDGGVDMLLNDNGGGVDTLLNGNDRRVDMFSPETHDRKNEVVQGALANDLSLELGSVSLDLSQNDNSQIGNNISMPHDRSYSDESSNSFDSDGLPISKSPGGNRTDTDNDNVSSKVTKNNEVNVEECLDSSSASYLKMRQETLPSALDDDDDLDNLIGQGLGLSNHSVSQGKSETMGDNLVPQMQSLDMKDGEDVSRKVKLKKPGFWDHSDSESDVDLHMMSKDATQKSKDDDDDDDFDFEFYD